MGLDSWKLALADWKIGSGGEKTVQGGCKIDSGGWACGFRGCKIVIGGWKLDLFAGHLHSPKLIEGPAPETSSFERISVGSGEGSGRMSAPMTFSGLVVGG